jgi:hypothetical protein
MQIACSPFAIAATSVKTRGNSGGGVVMAMPTRYSKLYDLFSVVDVCTITRIRKTSFQAISHAEAMQKPAF